MGISPGSQLVLKIRRRSNRTQLAGVVFRIRQIWAIADWIPCNKELKGPGWYFFFVIPESRSEEKEGGGRWVGQ